jgi:hypothetical protein
MMSCSGSCRPWSVGPLRLAAASLALIHLGVPACLEGQTVPRDCQSACALDHRQVALLGTPDGPGMVSEPSLLAVRSDGVFVLVDQTDRDRMKFFAPDGSYLRSLGRGGQGPGEFGTINALNVLPGDHVEVYDLGNGRFTLVGPDFVVGRISPPVGLMAPFVRVAPDGSRVANALSPDSDRLGYPLHWLAQDHEYETSLGADFTPGSTVDLKGWRRPMAEPTSRSIWVGHEARYRLEEWGRDGELLRVLERSVAWFAPWEGTAVWEEDGKPRPFLAEVHRDDHGRLWTLVRLPGERWEEGLGPGRELGGRVLGSTVTDRHLLWDTRIEVIDPERGIVLRSQHFDQSFQGFTNDGRVYAMVEVEGGRDVRIAVWELVEVGGIGASH